MYGLLVACGILLSVLLAEQLAKNKKLERALIWRVAFRGILFGVVGARIYHVVDYWDLYSQNLNSTLFIWNGGLGIIGGIMGGLLGIYSVSPKKYFLTILDIAATVMPLGQAIGRWGNYFNGELIPYAIYESLADILIFGFLFLRIRSDKYKTGEIFSMYLILYSLVRLGLDRFHNAQWFVDNFNITQIIAILTLIAFSINLWRIKKQKS
uniref:Prolipoprotein diacylglyceryl transferase n=1 Tax=candidate division WWE3 bacterium TaxID=2053526 RepID=A0A7C4XTG6_UNCKA